MLLADLGNDIPNSGESLGGFRIGLGPAAVIGQARFTGTTFGGQLAVIEQPGALDRGQPVIREPPIAQARELLDLSGGTRIGLHQRDDIAIGQ